MTTRDATPQPCKRCLGKRQVLCEDGDEGEIMSCPDCEGTGEEFSDDSHEWLHDEAR